MRIHFISIGGSVMHQLAIALQHKGYNVSGSDDEIFEPAKSNLKAANLLPDTLGWDPAIITKSLDAVILGMHARADNPELLQAQQLKLNIYSFPEYIYQESKTKNRIVIGGSHGKTTTTAMIIHVLQKAQLKFDYLVGAQLEGLSNSVQISDAPLIVCEGDEYPASALLPQPKFHFLRPHIAVLTGIAWDHINVFPTFENYLLQFQIFIEKIETGGLLIYNASDKMLCEIISKAPRKNIRYQPYNLPEHKIENGTTGVTLENESATLSIFGEHNLQNLIAAYYVCKELQLSTTHFLTAIANFSGAANRLERWSQNAQTTVYRDFAHAPSKVHATVKAVKKQYPNKKLIAVLELHTYSSLREKFLHQYAGSMNNADVAIVFYAKHSLQLKQLPILSKELIQNGFAKNNLIVCNDTKSLLPILQQQDYTDANLLLMSSGNYDGLDMLSFAKQLTSTTL